MASAAALEDFAERYPGVYPLPDGGEAPIRAPSLEQRWKIASAYVQAGSLWSLVDPDRAAMLFARAASEQGKLGLSDSVVSAICAAPRTPGSWRYLFSEQAPWLTVRSPRADAVLLVGLWPLAAGVLARDEPGDLFERFAGEAQQFAALPTGRLGIPFTYHLGFNRAILDLRGGFDVNEPRRGELGTELLRATSALLARGAESVAATRTNRFQWNRGRPGLLPVEPELIAVAALAVMTWRDVVGGDLVDALSDQLNLPATVPLRVAMNIVDLPDRGEPVAA